MFGIGSKELFIFLIIVLVIFGPTKLPQLARAIGKSMRELKDGLSEAGGGDSNAKRTAATDEDKEWERKHNAPHSDAQPIHRSDEQKPKSA